MPIAPARQAADAPHHFIFVGIIVVAFTAGFSMVSLLMPLLAIDIGASAFMVGVLVSTMYIAPVGLAMPAGRIIDRIGTRLPIGLAAAGLAAASIIASMAPSLTTLLIIQVIVGASHLVFVLATQGLVSQLGSGRAGERNFGWYTTFQSAGQMVGPVVSGVILDLHGYPSAFFVAAVLCGGAAAASRALRRHEKAPVSAALPTTPAHQRTMLSTAMRLVLTNHGMRIGIAVSYAVLIAHSVRQAFFPVYMEQLSFSGSQIGLAVSTLGLASMLIRPFVSQIVHGLGSRSTSMLIMVGVLAAGVAGTSFFSSYPALIASSVLVGLGLGVTQPISMVAVADHVPRAMIGFAFGIRLTANRLAQLFGPILVGIVAELAGVRWVFITAAGFVALAIPLLVLWRKPFESAERVLREAR